MASVSTLHQVVCQAELVILHGMIRVHPGELEALAKSFYEVSSYESSSVNTRRVEIKATDRYSLQSFDYPVRP